MMQHSKRKTLNIFLLFSILGPGLISANAGNDAGGIFTYASVGASFGYRMIWGLIFITVSLAVVQEMNARMAIVTGKGLASLIRENFGVKLTFIAMLVLVIANFGVSIADFAGIAVSLELFGISKYISVPVFAIAIGLLVSKGSYRHVENVFLIFTFVFFSYIITCFLVRPDWGTVFHQSVIPTLDMNRNFLLTFIGMIGTTITPYMQFYLQSSIVDKRMKLSELGNAQTDACFGAVWGNAIAFFIIVCTAATLYKEKVSVTSAHQAAMALTPLAGHFASILFGAGLLGASVLACAVIPLSTSYAVCEAFGFESGVNTKARDASIFYGIYTLMIILGAAVVLIPGLSLVSLTLFTQQLAGMLCPVILIFMTLLVNNKRIMGKYVNNGLQNVLSMATVVFILAMTILLFIVLPFFYK